MSNPTGPEWWESVGPAADGERVERPETDASLPGDTTVPVWALFSIVLGLVVLSGSIIAMCLVGTAALLGWLVWTTGNDEAPRSRPPDGPVGGAGFRS